MYGEKNMSSRLSSFIKKKYIGKNKNLISLEDPYSIMPKILRSHSVTNAIDAGASNGRISKRLIQEFPNANVYAFEPNPHYFPVLKQYAQQENRFHPEFLGISDKEGKANLNITESLGNTSLFVPDEHLKKLQPEGSEIKKVEEIDIVTIDNWAKKRNIFSIELMKFDIQAGELKALQGAVDIISSSTLVIYTEILFNPIYENGAIFSEIDLFLRKYNFVLYDIYKPKYDPNGKVMWANAIFVNSEKLGI